MNIVKLRDINLVDNDKSKIELFKDKFKGRYVHCINWTYLIPLEEMNNEDAITLSQNLQSGSTTINSIEQHWFSLDELKGYVDEDETEKVKCNS